MSDIESNTEGLSACGALARKFDADRFYAALFAPAAARETLFALIAFNYEIARLREVISEPMIGEMRLTWWSEALDALEANRTPRAHPVTLALHTAYISRSFSLAPLRELIEARSFDQHNQPMADLSELVGYARSTGGKLARVMAEVLLRTDAQDERVLNAAETAGTSWALTGIIRSLRIHVSRGQVFLPVRELGARGLSTSAILDAKSSGALLVVIREIIARAREQLHAARQARFGAALPAVLYCAQLPIYWRKIMRADFDPFCSTTELSSLSRLASLLIASLIKKI